MNLMTICKSIGDVLYEKGVIGHCTVDLLAFPDPTTQGPGGNFREAHPLFWAVDLNCYMTDYASACYFFDFLMVSIIILTLFQEGRIDQLTDKYTINDEKSRMQRSGYNTGMSTNDGDSSLQRDAEDA